MPTLEELLSGKPEPVKVDPAEIASSLLAKQIFVVIDDDPTGSQSVSNLPILTTWNVSDFSWAFSQGKPAVYVIANTRSLDPAEAEFLNKEIASNALIAAEELDLELVFISRSDSTLRGHYPLEPETLANMMGSGQGVDGIVIVPAFPDAGRITVDAIHYAKIGEEYLPVGETEFAKDKTFGFNSSNLCEWVAEKTDGETPANSVIAINLAELRTDLEAVIQKLQSAKNRQAIICDVVVEDDLRRLALALIEAEKNGSRFIYRLGPTFVRARLGQAVPRVLTHDDVTANRKGETLVGGLVAVGSHTALTTSQLEELKERFAATQLELDVRELIKDTAATYISEIVERINESLKTNDVIISTSRELISGQTPEESLAISRRISAGVVETVAGVVAAVRPAFIVSKGGITSSDIAAKALQMSQAYVVGPMLPGLVSYWDAVTGPAQGIPYVVFPGNVGTSSSLADVVEKLKG
ncbi:MAG: four-carbon acid sugar kinase family protein [Arcanobacterium sp.]|nr:four-carbon acid sugar kinase family protein [Arcanobacterium sp.]